MTFESLSRLLGMVTSGALLVCTQRGLRGLLTSLTSPARDVCHGASERRDISTLSVIFVLSLFVLTGCAATYTPPPLTMAHPAHPEAMAVPDQPPSTTLAYGPSDIPSPQPAYAMAQSGTPEAQPSGQESQQTVVGEGKVVAVVPSSHQIVVDHEEITGFMDAMTMGYRVEPPSLIEEFNAGDQIRFTIDTQQKAIVKIEPQSQQTFVGEGKVIAVVPNAQQLVVDHGDIEGFMDAMTMGFRVDPPSLLEGMQAGDQIRFTIGAQQKAIVKIEQMNK